MIRINKLIMTLVLLLTAASGAWATVYSSEVDSKVIKVGDILTGGVSLLPPSYVGECDLILGLGRFRSNKVEYTLDHEVYCGAINSIGENAVILMNGAAPETFTPVDENGQDGNAWLVTGISGDGQNFIEIGVCGTYYDPNASSGTDLTSSDGVTWTLAEGLLDGDMELLVEYEPEVTLTMTDNVSIVAPIPAGVTDKGNGVYEVNPGTELQLQATVPEHYSFVGWSDLSADDAQYSANPRTVVVNGDMTITPILAIDTYTLTLGEIDPTKGSMKIAKAQESETVSWDAQFCHDVETFVDHSLQLVHNYNSKDGITVTMEGYDEMSGWVGGFFHVHKTDEKLIFTSTVGNISKIIIHNSVGGYPQGWMVDYDNSIAIWEGTPSATVELPGEVISNALQDISMEFIVGGSAGKIVDNGDGTYTVDYGTEVTLTAAAAEGYNVAGWKVGTETIATGEGIAYADYQDTEQQRMPATSTYTFTMTDAKTIAPVFGENEYNVEFAEGTNTSEWTATPNPAKTKATVTVTYTGTSRVMGVKAEKKAATPATPAESTVTWNSENISFLQLYEPSAPFTMMGITLSTSSMSNTADWRNIGIPTNDGLYFNVTTTGGYTFTAPSGKKFTKIELTVTNANGWTQVLLQSTLGTGWPSGGDAVTVVEDTKKVTWTGTAASTVGLLTDASYFNASPVTSIVLTLADAE